MSRFILVLAVALVFVAAGFGMKACSTLREQQLRTQPIPAGIVVLENGTVVEAPDGSVAQTLVDWLEMPRQTHHVFALGGVQFEGQEKVPTIATRLRIPALAKMLSAYPEVKARFIGHTSAASDRATKQAIEVARAEWAVDALTRAGIDSGRLSARASTEADRKPAPGALPERVDLELSND